MYPSRLHSSLPCEGNDDYDEPVCYGKLYMANGQSQFAQYNPDGSIAEKPFVIFVDEMPLKDALDKFHQNTEQLVSSRKFRVPFHIKPEDTVLA